MTLPDLIPPIVIGVIGILLVVIGPANPHRQSKTKFVRSRSWMDLVTNLVSKSE